MATYLLVWNPEKWQWTYIQESIDEVSKNGFSSDSWSSGVTKSIKPNDRLFLMKLGSSYPKGIVASGWATSSVYEKKHWGKGADTKSARYVNLDFDIILNPDVDEIFSLDRLTRGIYKNKKTWTPQGSGTSIPDEVAEQLERDWAIFLKLPAPAREINYVDDVDIQKTFEEGAPKKVTTTVYERSPIARAICIKAYGAVCYICGFDFAKRYGEVGKGFIHVHHLQPKAVIGKSSKINPIRDLRPVCPNCHAMIHQRKPVYSIEELKEIMKNVEK